MNSCAGVITMHHISQTPYLHLAICCCLQDLHVWQGTTGQQHRAPFDPSTHLCQGTYLPSEHRTQDFIFAQCLDTLQHHIVLNNHSVNAGQDLLSLALVRNGCLLI